MKKQSKQLDKLQNDIDRIDSELISLLEKRLEKANDVERKEQLDISSSDDVKESTALKRLISQSNNPIIQESIISIFSIIFKQSKSKRILNSVLNPPFSKIAIIGLGIIGGSIAKTIKAKNTNINISTLDRVSRDIDSAKSKGYIDTVQSIKQLSQDTNLVILASPIDTILPIALKIKKQTATRKNKLIVMDCASVKVEITHEFEKLSDDHVDFVASHPMAGSEKIGFNNSKSTLFINQPWIITPHLNNTIDTMEKVHEFIVYLGGNPFVMESESHDKKVALISHLPFLLSHALDLFVKKYDKESLEIAGTGYKGMTRLAHGNKNMQSLIVRKNEINIKTMLSNFIKFLSSYEYKD